MVAKKFVPSLEGLSSLGFEDRNLGCPWNFAGMSRTPGGVQKVSAKNSCAFFVPSSREATSRHMSHICAHPQAGSVPENSNLVDVSDYFFFFLLGGGERGVRGAGMLGRDDFLGGSPGRVGAGGRRGWEGVCGESGGWGLNILFGAEIPTKLTSFNKESRRARNYTLCGPRWHVRDTTLDPKFSPEKIYVGPLFHQQ